MIWNFKLTKPLYSPCYFFHSVFTTSIATLTRTLNIHAFLKNKTNRVTIRYEDKIYQMCLHNQANNGVFHSGKSANPVATGRLQDRVEFNLVVKGCFLEKCGFVLMSEGQRNQVLMSVKATISRGNRVDPFTKKEQEQPVKNSAPFPWTYVDTHLEGTALQRKVSCFT